MNIGTRESDGTSATRNTSVSLSSLTGREIAISRSTMNWKEFLIGKIINLFRRTFLEVSLFDSIILN